MTNCTYSIVNETIIPPIGPVEFGNDSLFHTASDVSISSLLDGIYNISVFCMNSTNATDNTISFRKDTTAPTITLPVYTNATFKQNTSTLILNVSVVDLGIGATFCDININGTNQTVAVSNGWCNSSSLYLTNLTDGNRTILVYANDTLGNIALKNTYVVQLDTTAPTISISDSSSSQTELGLSVTVSDSGSGFNGTCTTSRGTLSGSSSPLSISSDNLDCGESYGYTVTCYDSDGNSASSYASFSTDSCLSSSGGSTLSSWTVTHTLTDSQLLAGSTWDLGLKHRFKITVGGQSHSVGVSSIDYANKKVTINVSSTPQIKTLSVGESWKVDVDSNGVYDILLSVKNITSSGAKINIVKVNESVVASSNAPVANAPGVTANSSDTPLASTNQASTFENDKSSTMSLLWLIIGLIVLVILFFVVKFWYLHHKENKIMHKIRYTSKYH